MVDDSVPLWVVRVQGFDDGAGEITLECWTGSVEFVEYGVNLLLYGCG
jgi:hypothetical protein